VKKDETIWIGSVSVSLSELKNKMSAIMEARENKQIYIQADKQASYGIVAAVLGELKAANLHSIGLVTLPVDQR
jgi:biopolymer transport protein ExbD